MKTFMLALLLLTTTAASGQDNSVVLRLASSQFSGESASIEGEESLPLSLSSNAGYGIGFTHQFSPRFSAAFDVMRLRPDVKADVGGIALDGGTLSLTPLTAIARVHGRYVYAGAGLAYVMTGDLRSADLDSDGVGGVSVDNDVTYVLNAGVSVPAGKSLHIDFDARYFPAEADATTTAGRGRLKFNSLLLGVGLGWRF
jgi:outer membrane protein W